MRLAAALVVLSFAAPVQAVPVFMDDFESGAVLSSSDRVGKWNDSYVGGSNSSVAASQSAARRGDWGFRMQDGDGRSGARTEGQIEKTVSGRNSYYMRYWFRMSSLAPGGIIVSQFCSSSCNEGYGDAYLMDDRTVGAAGASGSNYAYTASSPAFRIPTGTWHLIETAANNLGSSTGGRRRVWVNGQLVADANGLNLSGKSVGLLVLGQPWSDAGGSSSGTFRGDLDFDDFYVDDKPLPSHFEVEGPTSVAADACVPLTVTLRDSVSNALAPAPYDVSGIPVSVTGATAAIYSNSTCTIAANNAAIAVDSTSRVLYLKASSTGTATVTVGNASGDFLPTQRSFTVEAGTPPTSPNGDPCSQSSQCTSGFCVDGVCCNSACNAGACDACSVSQGAAVNGTCRVLPAGTVCREASDDCDAEETCNGNAGACPSDALAPSSLVCREETVTHSASYCTGKGNTCPASGLKPVPSEPDKEPIVAPDEPDGVSSTPDDGDGSAVAPESDAETGCAASDCVESADLGFSCASAGEAGLLSILGCFVLLLCDWRRRAKSGALPPGSL